MIDTPRIEIYIPPNKHRGIHPQFYKVLDSCHLNPTFGAFFRFGPKGIGLQMTHETDPSLTGDLDELKTRLLTTESKVRYFVLIIPQGQVFSCTKAPDEWLSELPNLPSLSLRWSVVRISNSHWIRED